MVNSNQWVATDDLGRKLPSATETGGIRKNKYVAIFYWTWHTDGNATFSPVMNITRILNQFPEAATNADHPAWQGITPGVFWWDEPLFGYYRSTDEWVLRKHAEMLADAGVDVVFFDCTNGSLTWKSSYPKLLEVWDKARNDGVRTPQIAFMLPLSAGTNSLTSLNEIYTDLYKPGLYRNLWFLWEGKPLIMAYPESLIPQTGSKAGMKFTAKSPFSAIRVTCPSWSNNIGNLTLKIYSWNGSYTGSVASVPIAEKTYVNFQDNAKLAVAFDQQKAGDFVWELSNASEKVGVWKWTDSNDQVISYFNGQPVTGNYESEIYYVSDGLFTQLTKGSTHVPVEMTEPIDQLKINEIKTSFTFRPGQPDYVNGPSRNDQWGWLEVNPQHGFGPKPGGGYEQCAVGVAQNASPSSKGHAAAFNNPETFGRSYTRAYGQDSRPNAYLYGLNFQEQWNHAFTIDPDLVFVTGWNEWIAGRWFNWDVKPFSFVDEYSAEKSRDIEPVKSWGNSGDNYYLQLVGNVRRFKGMESPDSASAAITIDLSDQDCWSNVKPEYVSYKGNTLHRSHPGQGNNLIYTNTTGRNDLVLAKVAQDKDYVCFYVETASDLTLPSSPGWMRLFIDIDRDKSTGWEGYDFILNRNSPGDKIIVEKSKSGWTWNKVGEATYNINKNKLTLQIPRTTLGLVEKQPLNFEFKWSDNMQEDGNIMDFYVNGDAAPGGRFNFVYQSNDKITQANNRNYPRNLSLQLYPNPADNELYAELPVTPGHPVSFNVVDMSGNEIMRNKTFSEKVNRINTSGLKEGVYILKVQLENGINLHQKFLLKK